MTCCGKTAVLGYISKFYGNVVILGVIHIPLFFLKKLFFNEILARKFCLCKSKFFITMVKIFD